MHVARLLHAPYILPLAKTHTGPNHVVPDITDTKPGPYLCVQWVNVYMQVIPAWVRFVDIGGAGCASDRPCVGDYLVLATLLVMI